MVPAGPIIRYLERSRDAISAALVDRKLIVALVKAVERIEAALSAGRKVLFVGNGGSAADAQHLAAEFVGRFARDREPLAALALTTDTSALTAIANDYGYDRVFERQVLALGQPGDVLIALSTSGRSPNVLRAITAARSRGLVTIGFTGASGGDMASECDVCLRAPSDSTALIQQLHITFGHVVCGLIEERRPTIFTFTSDDDQR